ncbi:MAG: hypothetical protein GY762_21510 [Proteobacteria bacterium]|nr:hypothetical protein [Pseudomonadota bacterium]
MTVFRGAIFLILSLVALAAIHCDELEPPEGQLECSSDADCPPEWHCEVQGDGFCYSGSDVSPGVDGGS